MMNYHIETLPFSIHKKHPNKFDANGVLMSKIPYTQTYHYHATSIASYVIQTGDKSNLEWLLDNMEFDGAIHHSFVFPFYPMKNGWVGGLAQGLTISALAKNNHKKEAKKALSALNKYCYNGRSIEEYPGVEVLNGWIYAIFGIYDIDDKTFFKENINHLKSRLHLYDLGKWSRYDTYHQFPSTPFYHKVHLEQLSALYKLTEDSQFLKILNKWKRYSSFEIKKQMLKRYVMLFNKHGVFKTYKRYKQRKRWLSNECSSSV
jgi:heparosan-N-sulfate-glucuronate 5-epimerase